MADLISLITDVVGGSKNPDLKKPLGSYDISISNKGNNEYLKLFHKEDNKRVDSEYEKLLNDWIKNSGISKEEFFKYSQFQEEYRPGYTLPGYNYLGPGNTINSVVKPTNEADEIAKKHDEAYAAAENHQDIVNADKAINEFGFDIRKPGNVLGAILDLLTAKKHAEQIFGPIYPSGFYPASAHNPNNDHYSGSTVLHPISNTNSRTLSNPFEDDTSVIKYESQQTRPILMPNYNVPIPLRKDGKPYNKGNFSYIARKTQEELNKRQRLNEEAGEGTSGVSHPEPASPRRRIPVPRNTAAQPVDIEMNQPEDNNDQPEETTSGTGSSSNQNNDNSNKNISNKIYRPLRNANYSATLTFSKQFFVMTYGFSYSVLDNRHVSTPLFCLPVEFPCLYFSPAEFNSLPATAKPLRCVIRVTPAGYRSSFATGQSTSTYANSAHSLFGVHAVGLNHKIYCTHGQYSIDGNKEMIPTGFTNIKNTTFEDAFYGTQISVGCVMGPHKHINSYLILAKDDDHGYNPLKNYIKEYDLLAYMGKPIIHFEYDFPKEGFIKHKKSVILTPGPRVGDYKQQYRISKKRGKRIEHCIPKTSTSNQEKPYIRILKDVEEIQINGAALNIPMHQSMMGYRNCSNMNESNTQQTAPWLYFGVQPVPSTVPNQSDSFTNVCVHYSIETFIEIAIGEGFDFIQSDGIINWKSKHLTSSVNYKDTIEDLMNRHNEQIDIEMK